VLDLPREMVDLSKMPTKALAVIKPIARPDDPPPKTQAA